MLVASAAVAAVAAVLLLAGRTGPSSLDEGKSPRPVAPTGDPVEEGPEGTAEPVPQEVVSVPATVETTPVPHSGDAADDPAVWIHPQDPSSSTIIGTDKQGGLLVFDLTGDQLQYLAVGEVNNVDVRSDLDPSTSFQLAGESVSLVVAGNRTTNSIDLHVVDPDSRLLREEAVAVVTPGIDVYGSCLHRSARDGAFSVFATSKTGDVEQWQLSEDDGTVTAALVRSFDVGGQVEACVADEQLGHVYIGEEERGIWKYGAEPTDGSTRTLVAATTSSGPLVADVEGLALTYEPDGTGYLLASSQGDGTYAVYRREGDNSFVKSFRITGSDGVDGTSDTDGIDVTTACLGTAFPHGVFVAQDGDNDGGHQNFKLVPYETLLLESSGR